MPETYPYLSVSYPQNNSRRYQKTTLDNLDIRYQNEDSSKRTRLEAWLTFLSDDNPKGILRLLEEYPEFNKLYGEGCSIVTERRGTCRSANTYCRVGSTIEEVKLITGQSLLALPLKNI